MDLFIDVIWLVCKWLFGITFFICLVMGLLDQDDDDWAQSKAYKDLRETTLNREDD